MGSVAVCAGCGLVVALACDPRREGGGWLLSRSPKLRTPNDLTLTRRLGLVEALAIEPGSRSVCAQMQSSLSKYEMKGFVAA